MISLFASVAAAVLAASTVSGSCATLRSSHDGKLNCRNQPGDPGYPTVNEWAALNATTGGRLIAVVPSAKACEQLDCTDAQWTSGISARPSLALWILCVYNWEQDYNTPAQLCLHNGTTCAQGMVPLYAINATTAQHIQAGVQFAQANSLRVSIKSSGHDYLGRSTAKNSLLLWTAHFQDDLGPAVTVGSGVGLKTIYAATKAQGKMWRLHSGAGHSAFAPIYGLAADNVFQYTIVLANGTLATANAVSNTDLFWALRGGGAGSWGQTGNVMAAHARHIKDWDQVKAGQYFYLTGSTTNSTLALSTFFKDLDGVSSKAQMAAFLANATALGATLQGESTVTTVPNDIVGFPDDASGYNTVLGSRLIPNSVYLSAPDSVGAAYTTLLKEGCQSILGHLVAGGQVSANANISSAINPAWRTAKTHVIVASQTWPDSTSVSDVLAIRQSMTSTYVPVLAQLAGGASSGSYSNEADVQEPDFQTTFYGPNYARLEQIKSAYDPNDLFIVPTGVRSEHWDSYGLCRRA
ncbi:hypothetical protein BC834DRAFT_1028892 [Gloeopeniophorella convolvens]|nr:hypothetical protein BC834DRAFT_1028892 [Gloeopeniophorella convolvens]